VIADVRSRARAATGELLTAVVALAGLSREEAERLLAVAAPFGAPVSVEALAVALHKAGGFGLQLVVTLPSPTPDEAGGER